MATSLVSLPAGLPTDPTLLATLLDLLPMGVIYYTPVVDAAGTLTDLALAYLNPAAQRMTGMPARPGTTYRQQFPTTDANGAWDFHRRTWLSGEPQHFQFYYNADGFDSYFRVAAQRLGEGLLAIFTDTQDEARSAAEDALRESQAREQAALAEAERQRGELARVFELAPVAIAVYQGPEHRIELANPVSCQLLNRPAEELLGKPLFEALPELAGHGFEQVLASVYTTGQPVLVQEQPGTHARAGRLDTLYWNLAFVPMRAPDGSITGALSAGLDVTEQVLARRQVQTLNEELAAINEELRATNEEYQLANLALGESQQQLRQLTQELEARVQARTQEAQSARRLAEVQRQRLEQLFMQAPAAICILDGPDLVYELVNPAYQQLFPGRALAGLPLLQALPELTDQPVWHTLQQVYRTGTTHLELGIHIPVARHAGGPLDDFYFDYIQQARFDAQGQVDGVVVFAFDVTEQVQARQQVEQLNQALEARVQERTRQVAAAQAATERERAKLQALIAQAPVAIALFEGDDLRVTSANAVIAGLWGYPPAQVVGRPLLEAVPELQGQGFDDLLRQVLHTQVPVTGTETPAVLLRDGQPQTSYYNFVYQPLYDADGQVLGVLNVSMEVTEQVLTRQQVEQLNQELEARVQGRTQEVQAALAEAERQRQRLVELVQQAPAAMCIVEGTEFVYEAFNPLYAEMFGGRPRVGRPMGEVLPEVVNHPGFLAFRGVYNEGHTIRQREVLVPLARPGDGVIEDRYFSYTQQPRYDQQGQVNGVFVFAVEVTDQVQARQQVQDLNEKLAAINEELTVTNEELNESNTLLTRTNVDLDTFVYTASHDLKAPITNIESIVLALRDTLPADVQQEEMIAHLLDLLEQTTARFKLTIGQLTDLTKLQLAHAGPAEPVPLAAVIEAVRLDLAPALTAAAAQLTVEVAPDLLVSFSPANLRSAIYNLLSNAVKYRALDRLAQVRVRAYSAGPRVVLEVQDNGLGLNAHQQSRLFGLFQRLHTHVEGTGVGLYITKRLVENGGGTIAVESHVEVGTTFTLTFPA